MTIEDVRAELLRQVEAAGGFAAWAEDKGLSVSYVHDAAHGKRGIGAKIQTAMGIREVVRFEEVAQ